jgi:uncharacterized membrane protein
MARKSLILLLGILLLGFILRVCKITEMPMYGDELTMVYDSYSILKTGKDATGESFPLTFKMGAGRPGGYVYASIPFVYLFGSSELGVRSLSLISGLGVIVLMYFLGRKLFNNKVGMIAGFLASISLWDIYLSRGGFEAHFALFLALLGVTGFLYKKYLLWALSWGFALLTYPTFKLTLPIVFLILAWWGGVKELLKAKQFVISLIILAIFGGIAIGESFKGVSEERFLRLNIFADKDLKEMVIQKVNAERNFSTLPSALKPIFYNKPLEYSRILSKTYIDNISYRFLYFDGDGNPRVNPGESGMLFLVELPLFFIGLFHLLKKNLKEAAFIITWILVVPLATMFLGQVHGLRNAFMLPPLLLISAFAISKISKRFLFVVTGLILIQLLFVLQRVYFLAPQKFSSFWSAEAKRVSIEAMNAKTGEEVILSTRIDNIEYAYPVYAKIDPKLVIEQYGKFPKQYGSIVITDK